MLSRIKNRIESLYRRHVAGVCFDRHGPGNTLLLLSSPRSGSTWLQEVLAAGNRCRVIFEPFHPSHVRACRDWGSRYYLGRDDINADKQAYILAVLEGRIRDPWVDQDNRCRLPRMRLIKAVRATMFAAWIKTNAPAVKLVYLLRNPWDVSRSQVRLGWENHLEMILTQQKLVDRYLRQDRDFLASLQTPLGKHAAVWAVENYVALRELRPGEATVVCYENLVANPHATIERVTAALNLPVHAATNRALEQRSRTTWSQTQYPNAEASCQQREEVASVLQRFGFDRLYPEESPANPQCNPEDLMR